MDLRPGAGQKFETGVPFGLKPGISQRQFHNVTVHDAQIKRNY